MKRFHLAWFGNASPSGFHFRSSGGITDIAHLLDIATQLVPVLQRRGLVRRDYTGTTLRHHLFEF